MMASRFDEIIDRRNTNSYKWDTTPEGVIPMWVADMDFKTAPCIIDALLQRVQQGVFGYTKVPDEYYDATVNWFNKRHGWSFRPENIIYTSGVVPAISAIIKALTSPGDKVIVQTPAYNCFFSSIRNNKCILSSNRLIYNNESGRYSIDFDNLEKLASDESAKILLLCNPHNPAGRVWTKDELTAIADICKRHDVTVLSDEIHCELTYKDYKYTPFATVAETAGCRYVSCVSPSKAFNIAGLQIANIVCPDADMLRKIDRAINDNEVCDVNPFGVIATIEAYTNGADWLDELRGYLYNNYLYFSDFFNKNLPDFKVTPLEGTYLAWVNCSHPGMKAAEIEELLISRAAVRLNEGSMYGDGGDEFLRVNLACPRPVLADVLPRIAQVLKSLN